MALSIQCKRQLQRLKNLLAFLSVDCNSELNLNSSSEFPRTTEDKPHFSSSTVHEKRSTAAMSVLPQADIHPPHRIMYTQQLGWRAHTSPYWRWHQAVFLSLPWVIGSRVYVNTAKHMTWQVPPQRQWCSGTGLPPKEEGLALLPGLQIVQRFQKHASEMLLLQPSRNGHIRLMVLCRSCTILVKAVVPIAIPSHSLQHCHCSLSVDPMTNKQLQCGKARFPFFKPPWHHVLASRTTALSSNTVKRLRASTPQNILLVAQWRDREESLLGRVTGWLSQWHWDGKCLGKVYLNAVGNSTDGSSWGKTPFRQ